MNVDELTFLTLMNNRASAYIDAYEAECNNNNRNFNLFDAFDGLEENEMFVSALAAFNYQVENGGIMQWFDNGYDVTIDALEEFITTLIKANELAGRPVEYLNKLLESIDDINQNIEAFDDAKDAYTRACRDNSLLEAFSEDFIALLDKEQRNEMNTFDKWYYTINSQFLTDANAYFKTIIEQEKSEKYQFS